MKQSATLKRAENRHTKPSRGFTLLELLVVLAILSVVAAMAVPNIYNMAKNYRIRNDARVIVGQLTIARMRAAASFARVKVQCYSTSEGNYCDLQSRKDAGSEFAADSKVKEFLSAGDLWDYPSGAKGAGESQAAADAMPCGAIVFNSRGLPVYDSKVKSLASKYSACQATPTLKDGDVKDNYVIYLKQDSGAYYFAVVVDASGRANVWQWISGAWAQIKD